MNKSIRLCENKTFSWYELQKLRVALFNVFRIKIKGIAYEYNDTIAKYGIHTEAKLKKQLKHDIEVFIFGFVIGLAYNE